MGALQSSSLFGSRSSHSGGVHTDSTLGQLFLNLNACCLVVYTHLHFSKSFRICWKLCRLPHRGHFSVDPVFCSLLMILVTLSRLPCRFSRLKAFNFCMGQIPSLWRQAILFLIYEVTFGMITPKLTVNGSVPRVHYMQIQVGFRGDAITHRKAFKNVSFALSLSTVFTCCLFLALAILVFLIVSK